MDVVIPKSGRYVAAVSGGVDSMALLDILSRQGGLELIVAHLDHGIREDSAEDRKLVEETATKLGLDFVFEGVNLGSGASEAKAREVRYAFLRKVLKETNSQAIITAHHQDDLIETAIINMLRGTGRKGLTSLGSSGDMIRPLLNVSKADLIKYAKKHNLEWREDSTNTDKNYLRNYVRINLVPKLSSEDRQRMLDVINNMRNTNQELDTLLVKQLADQADDGSINRQWFNQLPHDVSREMMASWLRANDIRNFDSKTLERLVVAAKTGADGKTFPVISGYFMETNKHNLALAVPER